jgi:rare lipoprotein A (peptidoglycan hydrolase)
VTRRAIFTARRAVIFAGICGVLVACSTGGGRLTQQVFSTIIPKQPPKASVERLAMADLMTVSSAGASMAADAARGQILEPDPTAYDKEGMASWYGLNFHGRRTANGETFSRSELTAAHLSLPLPSYVRVTNLSNDRSIILRVNDRGPYVGKRLLDVSEQAAELLAFHRKGSTPVRVQYIGRAPKGVDDAAMLLASYRGPTLPVGDPMAFTEVEERAATIDNAAISALNRLVNEHAVENRIQVAFQVAAQAED